LLNAGYDDVLIQKWAAQGKAVGEMAKASEEIETIHSAKRAVQQEEAQRAALGMPPMSEQEKAEVRNNVIKPGTPEQQVFADMWHSFIKEHPDATAEQKADFAQKARSYGRNAGAQQSGAMMSYYKNAVPDASETEMAMIKSAFETKGAKAPAVVAQMTQAIDQIKGAAESGSPMQGEQRAQLLRQASGSLGDTGLSKEGLDMAAQNWLKTGQFPSRNWQANEQILTRASQMAKEQGIDPTSIPKAQQEFKSQQVGLQRYFSGPQGQQTIAINTVIDHLQTFRELSDAMKNGDFTLANRIGAVFAREVGQPEPTNAEFAAKLIAGEIMKSMQAAGAGGVEARASLGSEFNAAALSPDQAEGVSRTAKLLLAGKLFSLRLAFPQATGLDPDRYDQLLSNETRSQLLPIMRQDVAKKTGGATVPTESPPASMLKEGVVTTFKNGTSWILRGGQPVQVNQ